MNWTTGARDIRAVAKFDDDVLAFWWNALYSLPAPVLGSGSNWISNCRMRSTKYIEHEADVYNISIETGEAHLNAAPTTLRRRTPCSSVAKDSILYHIKWALRILCTAIYNSSYGIASCALETKSERNGADVLLAHSTAIWIPKWYGSRFYFSLFNFVWDYKE